MPVRRLRKARAAPAPAQAAFRISLSPFHSPSSCSQEERAARAHVRGRTGTREATQPLQLKELPAEGVGGRSSRPGKGGSGAGASLAAMATGPPLQTTDGFPALT